ncbi:MAG: hypothetical protein AB7O67_08410 [Vicinamibacterales bacterium]
MTPTRHAIAVGLLLLLGGAGCSDRTPALGPSPVDLGGLWIGQFTLGACSHPNCGFVTTAPSSYAVTLTVTGSGARATGVLTIDTWLPDGMTVVVQADGSVVHVSGSTMATSGGYCQEPPWTFTLESWNATVDASGRRLTGAFTFRTQKHLTSCYFVNDLVVHADLLQLAR